MVRTRGLVASLLFGSGFCALVYQVAWLRLFRLVFGSSTAASAAVLAIFMAGLGAGSLILGPRADRVGNPLALYALLEAGIAVAAGFSPLVLAGARWIYIALGGELALGLTGGTLVRLLLSTLVLAVPTFLMGGTLPAAVRSVTGRHDTGRRALGLLYASNTLGAVTGAALTTFLLVEALGVRRTVILAALINLLVAVLARSFSRTIEAMPEDADEPPEDPQHPPAVVAPMVVVLVAAGVVGFAFFLMELVWYRMLAPILGGSTYTFGIILAVALAGIGAGGLAYAAGAADRRPDLVAFAATCALEALLMLVPFALGDHIAYLAYLLRGMQAFGFVGMVAAWSAVAIVVVLPASIVAGYQFPLLVAVLGSGRRRVAREIGLAYGWNTGGAILGSLAGGFGLLPLLGAPGAWRLAAGTLLVLAMVCLLVGARGATSPRWRPALLLVLAIPLLGASGPGAIWRHGEIGVGRFEADFDGPNQFLRGRNVAERDIYWEADGRESSVAIRHANGFSFTVNGKTDGHARLDAPTQVMSPLVGAVLHGAPRQALVIGLGTGESAGWLAEVDTIERVDVVELEPVILEVARLCAPLNYGALDHPKVEIVFGDGRELLLTMDRRYDLIFSEPSNPYRLGISSLFTREFYEAVAGGLEPGGVFVQWLQGYEVDSRVVTTVYATLAEVFPEVETWEVHSGDLLLVATLEPIVHDPIALRRRLAAEPYRSALPLIWGVQGLEGFYAGYVASPELARELAARHSDLVNTDDHPIIEYGFARNLGRFGLFTVHQLRRLARSWEAQRPTLSGPGQVDWELVEDLRYARGTMLEEVPPGPPVGALPGANPRAAARRAYAEGRTRRAAEHWLAQDREPDARLDLALLAEGLAELADERARVYAEQLRVLEPVEAEAILARLAARQGRFDEARDRLVAAFTGYREDPWPIPALMIRALELTRQLSRWHPTSAPALYDAIAQPFSIHLLEWRRRHVQGLILDDIDFIQRCVPFFELYEPHPDWAEAFLERRAACYRLNNHALAVAAQEDMMRFVNNEPPSLEGEPASAAPEEGP